jgi:hypothetical protein
LTPKCKYHDTGVHTLSVRIQRVNKHIENLTFQECVHEKSSLAFIQSEAPSTGAKQPKCDCNHFHLHGTSVNNVGRPSAKDTLTLCNNLRISFGICSYLLSQGVRQSHLSEYNFQAS